MNTTAGRKTDKPCNCFKAQALDELLSALDPLIAAGMNDVSSVDLAANINLLIQGAKAMAEIDDE